MLNNIKNVFFIRNLFKSIKEGTCLKLVKYNKQLQRKLYITIKDYIKYYNQIVIEIITRF